MADIRLTLDVLSAPREGTAGIERRQRARLATLVGHAREHSRFYERRYRDVPPEAPSLKDLPPVTKPELMDGFDGWTTDASVTRIGVEAFVSDRSKIGEPFEGRYLVCSTSGTTGHPGLFLHDAFSVALFRALTLRVDFAWLALRDWAALAARGLRWAAVVGTGGHFGGEGWMEFQRRANPVWRRAYRVFSAQQPLDRLVGQLDAFDPAILTGYPSSLALVADAHAEGRCRLRPIVLETAGESITPAEHDRLESVFGVPHHEMYAASEFLQIAYDCPQRWLHVNADWLILEPVDERGHPTQPGRPSHTVLLTNLANRTQPLIRYDLGDSVVARPDPCPCGSPFPAIRVAGRRDDVLGLPTRTGGIVRLPPLAIGAVVERTHSVHRSQIVQTDLLTLRVRLEPRAGEDVERMWTSVLADLGRYLHEQGATEVTLVRADETPHQDERSGKLHQVIGAPDRGRTR